MTTRNAYEEQTFDFVDAGASLTEPRRCSLLRLNGHVVFSGRPCKIVEMTTAKSGKHGSAKVHLVAIDIFTGKKMMEIITSTVNVEVPRITRTEYDVIDVSSGFLSLLCDDGTVKCDVRIPDSEFGREIKERFIHKPDNAYAIVSVLAAMGEEHPIAIRIAIDNG